MAKWGIGQKLMVVIGVIFLLFAIGISFVVGNSSSNDLESMKQDELDRMSRILAGRIAEMEQNAARTAKSMEESEPMVEEVQLLTNRGPYYADPGSFFEEEFVQPGDPIEASSQIYAFQSQLNLVQLLRSAQRLNNLTAISFYLVPPFDVVSGVSPVLALRLGEERIVLTRFTEKVDLDSRVMYSVDADAFRPPAPDYFDISTAYSAPPDQFYAEQNFTPMDEDVDYEFFQRGWVEDAPPRSELVVKEGVPVLQTWYPVKVPVANPESWEKETVPVGLVLIEQKFDAAVMAALKDRLGLNVGLARGGKLLTTSFGDNGGGELGGMGVSENGEMVLSFAQTDFYYALESVELSGPQSTTSASNLQAVVLSPVSEVEQVTQRVIRRIWLTGGLGALLTGVVVYFSLQYIVGRPLDVLAQGVERIAAGDLDYRVPVRSRSGSNWLASTTAAEAATFPHHVHAHDELGQLASAFNEMAARLHNLIESLEKRVAERTQDLAERARYLEATAEVAHDAASELDLDDLLSRVVRLISQRFEFYHSGLFLIDESGEWAVLQAASSAGGRRMLNRGHRLKVGETGTVGYVTAYGEPRIALDVGDDAVFFDNPDLPETHSAITLPLRARGEIIGALDVQSKEPRAFTDEDAAVLQVLADQVAMAISNARLFQRVQESLEAERRAYGELSQRAWQEMVKSQTQLGYVSDVQGIHPVEDEPSSVVSLVSREGRIVQEDEITLVIPVRIRGNVIGVVRLRKSDADDAWTEEEITLMEAVTEQLNVALESARLYEDTQRRAARERLTSEITAQMRETLDMDTVLQTTIREIGSALDVAKIKLRMRGRDGQ
jgi:GAF domain-containing protein/HAMP domain-containing protein